MTKNEPLKAHKPSFVQGFVEFIYNKFFSPCKVNGKEVSRSYYAKKSGISTGTIKRFEENKNYNARLTTVYRICEFEKISMRDLYIEFEDSLKKK